MPESRSSRPRSRCTPKTPIEVDEHVARQNLRLIEALEDLDDVQRVTANFDLPAEILAEAAAV